MQGKAIDRIRQTIWEQCFLFAMGGTAYLRVELAWRGATHWTMFLAGGLCFCLLVRLEAAHRLPVAAGAAIAAACITLLELAVGQACLSFLGLRVWDYRSEWGNLAGFICPKYTTLWYLLCLWLLFLLRLVRGIPQLRPLPATGM